MADTPGFFERVARWEYDQPIVASFLMFGGMALFAWGTGDGFFALLLVGIAVMRSWLLRDGGSLRRRYRKKYGWD